VAPRLGLRVGGVTVDHGLQPGSAERAAGVAALLGQLGLDPVRSVAVTVPPAGRRGRALRPRPGRPGTTRLTRRPGITVPPRCCSATPSTTRRKPSCSGWRAGPAAGRWRACPRGAAATAGRCWRCAGRHRAACTELGLEPWQDPHNSDFRYARARVRHQALPALETALGPGVAEALARTASQLRADAECLDELAFAESGQLRGDCSDPAGLEAGWLRALPAAIRTRVLRDAAIMAGCPHGALTAGHVGAIDALVTDWHGQRWVDLPGGVRARRRDGKVWFTSTAGD
jgi:tRNA(Ile)-lysidine synthase